MSKIKDLRQQTGLSQSRFAEKFHIKLRTLQEWEYGRTAAPEYVVFMIDRIIELESQLGGDNNG